jgi:hypothetical protein
MLVDYDEPHGAQVKVSDLADHRLRRVGLRIAQQAVLGHEPRLADTGRAAGRPRGLRG